MLHLCVHSLITIMDALRCNWGDCKGFLSDIYDAFFHKSSCIIALGIQYSNIAVCYTCVYILPLRRHWDATEVTGGWIKPFTLTYSYACRTAPMQLLVKKSVYIPIVTMQVFLFAATCTHALPYYLTSKYK